MRIGIDARELTGKPTGVGRYLSGLLAEWVGEPRSPQHDFVLYTHEPLPPGPDAGPLPHTAPGAPPPALAPNAR